MLDHFDLTPVASTPETHARHLRQGDRLSGKEGMLSSYSLGSHRHRHVQNYDNMATTTTSSYSGWLDLSVTCVLCLTHPKNEISLTTSEMKNAFSQM